MSGSIPFQSIPPNVRVPLFYAEFSSVAAGASQPVQRGLVLGQSVNTIVSVPEFCPSVQWAQQTFGVGSQIANALAAYRANDPVGELWVLPFNDAAAATAATGSIAVSGTATANGTVFLYIPNPYQNNAPIQVGVANGDAAATVATNIAAAINAVPYLPVSATAATSTVTITAKNKGTLGNDIPIVLNYLGATGSQATPAGLTISITPMANGATDPSLGGIATTLGTAPFDFILNPYVSAVSSTTALMSDQSGRWSWSSMLWGHVFSAKRDTVANLLTFGGTVNDQHLTVLGVNSGSPTPAWVWLAAVVGALAPSIKTQPNRPLQTLNVAAVLPEQTGQEIGLSNEQTLLSSGIALARRTASGSAAIVRMVTTYQTNAYGVSDTAYLDTEDMYSLMGMIRYLQGGITNAFPRALVADDGTPLGVTSPGDTAGIVTPSVARNELIGLYNDLCKPNGAYPLPLCDNPAAFAAGLIVQRNANDNSRMDVLFDPYLVSGLRIFAVLTQFHKLPLAA